MISFRTVTINYRCMQVDKRSRENTVGLMAYQGTARPEGRVVELREGGAGAGAVGAHAGLRTDERLHALQRGGGLLAHEVPAHQRL